MAFGETLQRLNLVVGDGNDLEAVLVDVINFVIPSDRWANAGWSPGQGAGEQHNQTAVLLQRYEALHLIGLIGHFELVGNGLPNLRTLGTLRMGCRRAQYESPGKCHGCRSAGDRSGT